MTTLEPTGDTQTGNTGLKLIRITTWVWLSIVLTAASAGLASAYRDPSLIRIEEFSAIYQSVGLSDRVMMTAVLVLPLVVAVVTGGLIAVRRPDDRAALVLAMCMVGLYYFTSGVYAGIETRWIRNGSASLAVVLIAVFLVAFPSGTFRPKWSVAAPLTALTIAVFEPSLAADTRVLLTKWQPDEVPFAAWAGWSLIIGVAAVAQMTRYRVISTDVERHQARWVMLGAFWIVIGPAALLVLNAQGRGSPLLAGLLAALSSVGSYLLPATLLIAVFRYHLYDIDAVISRTVTYSMVAIVVTAAFVVPVLMLGSILGESNDLVVAGSTLLAAAVFAPARRRIQRAVERRFNRTTYDTEQVMDGFTAGLRADLSVESVATRLERAVDRTVQPTGTSIWIRERQ